jgi:hypothetical protein
MSSGEVPPGIHCCICLNREAGRVQAVTIVKGYAVCEEHVELVSNPGFDIFKIKSQRKGAV